MLVWGPAEDRKDNLLFTEKYLEDTDRKKISPSTPPPRN